MRDELARVLAYPQIVPRLAFYRLEAGDVLAAFDRQSRLVDVAPKAAMTCNDPDDQKFIDLAVAHQAHAAEQGPRGAALEETPADPGRRDGQGAGTGGPVTTWKARP